MIEFTSVNGESIFNFVERVQKNLEHKQRIMVKFNGISISISKNSCDSDIAIIYNLKCALRDIKEY